MKYRKLILASLVLITSMSSVACVNKIEQEARQEQAEIEEYIENTQIKADNKEYTSIQKLYLNTNINDYYNEENFEDFEKQNIYNKNEGYSTYCFSSTKDNDNITLYIDDNNYIYRIHYENENANCEVTEYKEFYVYYGKGNRMKYYTVDSKEEQLEKLIY